MNARLRFMMGPRTKYILWMLGQDSAARCDLTLKDDGYDRAIQLYGFDILPMMRPVTLSGR
uniref:Uncharacterized protein n=1 Tax=Acidithiobacillus sulfuriphilus TaxID=1867749 RepID=A0A3M8RSX1_9PROT|nr:hypothetical protein EC580_01505 [Acidithiobacillus sulfuriphilus]